MIWGHCDFVGKRTLLPGWSENSVTLWDQDHCFLIWKHCNQGVGVGNQGYCYLTDLRTLWLVSTKTIVTPFENILAWKESWSFYFIWRYYNLEENTDYCFLVIWEYCYMGRGGKRQSLPGWSEDIVTLENQDHCYLIDLRKVQSWSIKTIAIWLISEHCNLGESRPLLPEWYENIVTWCPRPLLSYISENLVTWGEGDTGLCYMAGLRML